MKFSKKHGLIWALIFAGACALYMGNNMLRRPSLANQPLSVFLQRAQEQRIQHVVLQDQSMKITEKDGSVYTVQTPGFFNTFRFLAHNRIPFGYVSRPPEAKNQLPQVLAALKPLAFVLQKKIAPHVTGKSVPRIRFVADQRMGRGDSVEQLLMAVQKDWLT
jgi:hypothetical protein